MNTHPTLSRGITIQGYRDEYLDEAVEYASFETGAPFANKLYTLSPRRFQFNMHNVSQSDKQTAMAFWVNNMDLPFWWNNEQEDNTLMAVMFHAKPSCQIQDNDSKSRWVLGYDLVQIDETELPSGVATNIFYGGDSMIIVPNLATGVSHTARWTASQGIVINSCWLLTKSTPSGIDDSNTVSIILKNEGTIFLTRTYNTGTQPPDSDTEDLTAYLDSNYTTINAGSLVTAVITQGATANMPAFDVFFGGYYT